jgi:hypothetical protein
MWSGVLLLFWLLRFLTVGMRGDGLIDAGIVGTDMMSTELGAVAKSRVAIAVPSKLEFMAD